MEDSMYLFWVQDGKANGWISALKDKSRSTARKFLDREFDMLTTRAVHTSRGERRAWQREFGKAVISEAQMGFRVDGKKIELRSWTA